MKLYNVTNISGLFDVLDSLASDVTVQTADGASFDWRTQKEAFRSLAASFSIPNLRELRLSFRNGEDAGSVLHYLMECRRSSRAA